MIESIVSNRLFRLFAPPVVAVVLIGTFVSLGFWQLDRAQQKIDLQRQFEDGSAYLPLTGALPERLFQPIEARGQFLDDRQILIENSSGGGNSEVQAGLRINFRAANAAGDAITLAGSTAIT